MQIKKLLLLAILILAVFFGAATGMTYALNSTEESAGAGVFQSGTMDAEVS